MVDRDRVDQLFAMLTRYVRILRDLADMPLSEYQADPRNFGSAERFLQLAIETTLSVGHHIIASAGFGQPATYAEVFRVLGKEGVLDAEFAATLEPMARLRNRPDHRSRSGVSGQPGLSWISYQPWQSSRRLALLLPTRH